MPVALGDAGGRQLRCGHDRRRGAPPARRIAKTCQNHGQRVQFSVFECEVTPGDWVKLRARLLEEMSEEKDSLRFYVLGADGKRRIEHAGNRRPIQLDGPLMV